MKIKPFLTQILILISLALTTFGAYRLAGSLPRSIPGLPPFSKIRLPSQTQNGITVSIEAYYADASRLLFRVRLKGDGSLIDQASFTDETGSELSASVGFAGIGGNDPALNLIELDPVTPLETDRLKGRLDFAVIASPGAGKILSRFSFDLDIPVKPVLTYNPKQTVWADGLEILLDRLVITPAQTYAYLCYIKPTEADWMIGGEASVKFGYQQITVNSYGLLFDSDIGDLGKGPEPGWIVPVQQGRCVKIGFPLGDAHPKSLTLTIPALEQSMPEVIPSEKLAPALEKLSAQGIDMEWHTVDHGAYPEYRRLPAGMSEQMAYRKFIEALGYVHPGPWVFDLQLEPQETSQPVFSTSSYGAATPIPLPTHKPREIASLPGRVHSFDVSPDLKNIAFATSRGVVLYDLKSYKRLRTFNDPGNTFAVTWSPDGTKLAAGGIIMHFTESGVYHLVVRDTSTWETIFERKGDEEVSIPFGELTWSPDSRRLATALLPDRGLVVLDVKTGNIVSDQQDFLVPPYDIDWSPDGSRLIATGDLGYGFRRWRLDTDEAVRLYDPRAGTAAIQLAWSPDGERIASGHAGGMVCFWTAATNQCDGFIYAHQNIVSGLAWSPDGNQLATSGGVIRIWDTHTGQLLTAFGQNDGSVYTQLEWLDLKTLASLETGYASEALTIVRFWDVATGSVLFEFHGESSSFGQ